MIPAPKICMNSKLHRVATVLASLLMTLNAGCALESGEGLDDVDQLDNAVVEGNGMSLNGISVNGISVNGISVNGISVNGISVNGISVNGSTLTTMTASNQILSGDA